MSFRSSSYRPLHASVSHSPAPKFSDGSTHHDSQPSSPPCKLASSDIDIELFLFSIEMQYTGSIGLSARTVRRSIMWDCHRWKVNREHTTKMLLLQTSMGLILTSICKSHQSSQAIIPTAHLNLRVSSVLVSNAFRFVSEGRFVYLYTSNDVEPSIRILVVRPVEEAA